jgi:hypothetical protein
MFQGKWTSFKKSLQFHKHPDNLGLRATKNTGASPVTTTSVFQTTGRREKFPFGGNQSKKLRLLKITIVFGDNMKKRTKS